MIERFANWKITRSFFRFDPGALPWEFMEEKLEMTGNFSWKLVGFNGIEVDLMGFNNLVSFFQPRKKTGLTLLLLK